MTQIFATSLALASFYAIQAIGFVVLYRTSRILNFAQGEILLLGSYFALTLASVFPSNPLLVISGSIIGVLILGLFIYRLALRPSLGQPVMVPVIVTIGLSIFMRGIATAIWGSDKHYLAHLMGLEQTVVSVLPGAVLSLIDLAMITTAVVFLVGLLLFQKYVRTGIQMRAAAENPGLASYHSIDVYRIFLISWLIACFAATVGGLLYCAGRVLSPEVGFIGLKSFTVAVVGGLDSFLGVIPAALIVGLVETVVGRTYPWLSEVVPMLFLLLILIFRPWGFMGTKEEIERV